MAENVVRVGADPEFFVTNEKGTSLPICGLVGGTKDKPLQFTPTNWRPREDDFGYFAYQEDGCAFEFNVPATTDGRRTRDSVQRAMSYATNMLMKKNLFANIVPYVKFSAEQLKDPRANTIGCSPDMDAYAAPGGDMRKPFKAEDFGDLRFCGGHIHLGYNKENVPPFAMARFMDLMIGLPTIKADKQGMRRKYYGSAGLYREKPYGIEYRTLSNFWVNTAMRSDLASVFFRAIFQLGEVANTQPTTLEAAFHLIPWEDVKAAIDNEDVDAASRVYNYAVDTFRIPNTFSNDLWGMYQW